MPTRPADLKPIPRHEGDEPIPGFRLVRPRGRGGFGEVWEAEASGGFRVALKFVRLSSRALASEIRSLGFVRGIHHPNLLANFGAWEVEETLILGMELADRSLWDRYVEAADLGLAGIPRGELLGYLAEVAAGVDHLNGYRHTLDGRTGIGVQHRDLKPTNILLFGGGAKVADLGMARAMEGEVAGHTGIWTYSYAAPEFFRGETSRRSDQYGLAVTYCQLRTGRLPFEGNAASVTAGHLFGRPDLDALPEPERPVVERALAKTPGDRWPDCRAFVEALRAIPTGLAPDELIAPDDSYDIPREFRSSTGTGAVPGTGPDTTGWPEFAPTDGPWADLGSSDDASAPPPPAGDPADEPDQLDTQVFPAYRPEPEPEPHPVEPGEAPGRRSRIGRNAAVALIAALALLTAGVHRPARLDHAPAPVAIPGPPDPASIVGEGPGPGQEPAPAEPSTPDPIPARISPKAPEPEPEPAPATAAEQLGPARTPAADPGPADERPAIRSDLTPGPRDRPSRVAGRPGIGPTDPAIAKALGGDPGNPPAPADRPAEDPAAKTARASAALARGLSELNRGAFGPALAELDEAIRLDPARPASYLPRAVARHRSGYPKSALADYDEAIRLRPDDADAHIARGQAHHDLGAFGRAIVDFDEAIRLRPRDPDPRFRRGMARYRSDDYAGSVVDFDETLRLDPGNARASEFRTDALARLKSPTGRVPSTRPDAAPAPRRAKNTTDAPARFSGPRQ